MTGHVVLDVAGGGIGGAARWADELDGFLAGRAADGVTVLGRGRRLTPGWLLRRERHATGARIAVAANNASFSVGGAARRVVLRNALHFLRPDEEHLLAAMPLSFRAQIPVVRRLLGRADLIVVPSAAMAQRVGDRVPAVADRIVVRGHPVTPVGPRLPTATPFILVPVLPAPYKNLVSQVVALVEALDRRKRAIEVRVTARRGDLPGGLDRHPRVMTLGIRPHHALGGLWQRATAAFFPSAFPSPVEAFGYPLAEARVYGLPVIAPDTAQARQLAGAALLPYRPGDVDSLIAAIDRLDDPAGCPTIAAEPGAFDRDSYFRWLLGLPARPRVPVPQTLAP